MSVCYFGVFAFLFRRFVLPLLFQCVCFVLFYVFVELCLFDLLFVSVCVVFASGVLFGVSCFVLFIYIFFGGERLFAMCLMCLCLFVVGNVCC